MIHAVHATVFSRDAEATRAFFRDVLELDSVDAGGGWLIFALPPAELGVHPTDGEPQHELYLMCDDIEATVADLQAKGLELARPVSDRASASSPTSPCQGSESWASTSPATRARWAASRRRARGRRSPA